MNKVDMTPEKVSQRLKLASEMRSLCLKLSLAGRKSGLNSAEQSSGFPAKADSPGERACSESRRQPDDEVASKRHEDEKGRNSICVETI